VYCIAESLDRENLISLIRIKHPGEGEGEREPGSLPKEGGCGLGGSGQPGSGRRGPRVAFHVCIHIGIGMGGADLAGFVRSIES
jgi:hypothetical protein